MPRIMPPVALLLIDVIHDLAFPDGKALLKQAFPMAKRIAALKRRAKHAGMPSMYVNDHCGRWQADFQTMLLVSRTGLVKPPLVLAACPHQGRGVAPGHGRMAHHGLP
jgi:nicotinamidase-related amidase